MTHGKVVLLSQRLGNVTAEERRIEASGAEVRSAPLWNLDEIRTNGVEADMIILGAVEPFDAAALAALTHCRAVIRRGVGYDNVDVEAATRLGIVVANVPDASVEEVSDHALTLLLSLERRVIPLDAAVHAGKWQRDPSAVQAVRAPIRRFSELTLGVAGFGRIGRALARKGVGIYGSVLAADPFGDPAAAAALGVQLVSLPDLLARADHVSLHMPMGPDTHHLIDEAALATMRPGAMVANTARGGLIDEIALLLALESGHLGGAALDVTEREPVATDDPLLGNERVILTGHSALASVTAQQELGRRSVEAVVDLLAGRHPSSIVNREVLDSTLLRIPALAAARGSSR